MNVFMGDTDTVLGQTFIDMSAHLQLIAAFTNPHTHNTEIKRANLKTNECIINSKSHESCNIMSVLFSQREFGALIWSWC